MGLLGLDISTSQSFDQRVGASDNAQVAYNGTLLNPGAIYNAAGIYNQSGLVVSGRNNFVQLSDPNQGSKFAEILSSTISGIVDKASGLVDSIAGSGNYSTTGQLANSKAKMIIGAVVVVALAWFFFKRR